MPLRVEYKNHQDQALHLWHVSESESFFRDRTDINTAKWEEVSAWVSIRRLEWLAGRYLIHKYAGCTSKELIIDQFGKPQIPKTGEISISHSGAYAAIYVDHAPCGVDIQVYKESVLKLQHKFCTERDLQAFEEYQLMDALHLIWCSKEAVYKAYGEKEVDYKQHIHLTKSNKSITAELTKLAVPIKYDLQVKIIGELYLVSCRQV